MPVTLTKQRALEIQASQLDGYCASLTPELADELRRIVASETTADELADDTDYPAATINRHIPRGGFIEPHLHRLRAQMPPPEMPDTYTTPKALIEALKEHDQDFEFYPTTNEIIGAMVKDLREIRYLSVELEGRRYSNGCRAYESILDVGAGHGKTLEKIRDYFNRSDNDHCFGKLYAIEKSPILCEQLDPSIFIVGTEFEQQSLLSKQVDVIFSNPPYSVFTDWTVKILREAAAPLVYLVIPDRWEKDSLIDDALRYRNATPHIVGHFDFEHADRQARCHVHLLRIELSKDKDDAFERFFNEQFSDLKAKYDADSEKAKADKERSKDEEEEEREKRGRFGHLVVGPTYPEAMVNLYLDDIAKIRRNYEMVAQLDPDLMRELGISPAKIMECLKQRLNGLKNIYWKEIFDHLSAITDRLTSKKRGLLLGTLNSYCHVDFTLGNIHAVVIWVLKNANQYLDAQLCEVFEQMVEKANVRLYASNRRAFAEDRWRYNQDKEKQTHFCLEYRLVLHWLGGIKSGYSWEKGLADSACEFMQDLHTVARNLGYQCDTADRRLLDGRSEWVSNKLQTFYFSKPKPSSQIATGLGGDNTESPILFEARAFKNRNIHIRLHQRFALALNVEYGRLKGWLRSGEEAAKETGIPEAAACFRTYLTLPTSGSDVMCLMAPASEPAPKCVTVTHPDPAPAEPESEEPNELQVKFSGTHPNFQADLAAISEEGGLPVLEVYALWRDYSDKSYDQSAILSEFREWYAAKLGLKTRQQRDEEERTARTRITADSNGWADPWEKAGWGTATDRVTPDGKRIGIMRGVTGTGDTTLDVVELFDGGIRTITPRHTFPNMPAARAYVEATYAKADDSSHAAPLAGSEPSTETTDTDTMKRFNPITGTTATVATPVAEPPKPKRAMKRAATVPETGDFDQACVLLWSHTGHTGDFWRLMGPAHKATRAEIMHALMGRRIPQDECGLTVLRDLFWNKTGHDQQGTCTANREELFRTWLAAKVGHKAAPAVTAAPCVTVTQPPATALARAAHAVPVATFAAMLKTDANAAQIRKQEFVAWCKSHPFPDWRTAFTQWRATEQAPPPVEDTAPVEANKVIPFVQPDAPVTPAVMDSVALALAALQ